MTHNNFSRGAYSPLLTIVRNQICSHNSASKSKHTEGVSDTLVLQFIQHKGCRFLSDLQHTIQLILTQNQLEHQPLKIAPNPTNSLQSSLYRKINQNTYDFWEPYNCNRHDLLKADPLTYPNPYTPEFFMGKWYDQFKRKKSILKEVYLSSKTIKIYRWRLKMVNVSKTGWYAPTIEALQYKIDSSVGLRKQNFGNVTLILYEPDIKEAMEQIRLKDMRDLKKDKFDERCSISLTFFVREEPKNKGANIVRIDKKKELLQFNPNYKLNYIAFGELQGSSITTEKVDLPAIDTEKIKSEHFKNWQILMNSNPLKKSILRQGSNSIEQQLLNWSQQQSDENGFGGQDYNSSERMLEQSLQEMEEDCDDDMLKRLYRQQLNISKMRLL